MNYVDIHFKNIIKKYPLYENFINPLASPCAGAPALKYGYVNRETPPLAR